MTIVERMAALINAVANLTENGLPGDIVECGVWRGGSMLAVALTLLARGDRSQSLAKKYLFLPFVLLNIKTGI